VRDEATGIEASLAGVACDIPADGVVMPPPIQLALPDDWADGDYTLSLRLRSGDEVLSNNHYRIHLITRNPALAAEHSDVPARPG
jgi:hypothetical protein